MHLLRYLWFIPLLGLMYIYGNEVAGVFTGSTEHYEILSGLGFSAGITTALLWLSVLIEFAVIAAVFVRPCALTFSIAALWPWVPRIITAFTGGDMGDMTSGMNEMNMSLYATSFAMLAYAIYERDWYPHLLRKRQIA